MTSALVKFVNAQPVDPRRGRLYWGRLEEDGLPFRGHQAPLYSQEEHEQNLVRVGDPRNGTFRTWIEAENKLYLLVADMVINGWAKLLFIERWRDATTDRYVIYAEWSEYFMEDGRRTQAGLTAAEAGHGQVQSIGHP